MKAARGTEAAPKDPIHLVLQPGVLRDLAISFINLNNLNKTQSPIGGKWGRADEALISLEVHR